MFILSSFIFKLSQLNKKVYTVTERFLFSSCWSSLVFSSYLLALINEVISVYLFSHILLRVVFSLMTSSIWRFTLWICILRLSIYPRRSLTAFLLISILILNIVRFTCVSFMTFLSHLEPMRILIRSLQSHHSVLKSHVRDP